MSTVASGILIFLALAVQFYTLNLAQTHTHRTQIVRVPCEGGGGSVFPPMPS